MKVCHLFICIQTRFPLKYLHHEGGSAETYGLPTVGYRHCSAQLWPSLKVQSERLVEIMFVYVVFMFICLYSVYVYV